MNESNFKEVFQLEMTNIRALTLEEIDSVSGGMMKLNEGVDLSKLALYKEMYGEMWF